MLFRSIRNNLFIGTSTSLAQIYFYYDVDADIPQGIVVAENITIGNGYGIYSNGCYVLDITDNIIDMTVEDTSNVGCKLIGQSIIEPFTSVAFNSRNEHVIISNNWFAGGQDSQGSTQNGRSLWIGGYSKDVNIKGNIFPQSTPAVVSHTSNVIANGSPTDIRFVLNSFTNAYNATPFVMLYLENANNVNIDSSNSFTGGAGSTFYASNCVNLNWETLLLSSPPQLSGLTGSIGNWRNFSSSCTSTIVGSTPPTIATNFSKYSISGRIVNINAQYQVTNIEIGRAHV